MKHIKTFIACIAIFFCIASQKIFSQISGQPPSVEWNKYYWYPRTDNPAVPSDTHIDGGTSGEDWFYNVIMAKDQTGKPIGYLGVGYSTIPAIFTAQDGCGHNFSSATIDPDNNGVAAFVDDLNVPASGASSTSATDVWGHEDVLPKMALLDLNGNQVWYKVQGSLSANGSQNLTTGGNGGRYYGAIQTSDGGFIGVGEISPYYGINYYNAATLSGSASPIQLQCNQLSGKYPYMVKVDANGNVLWQAVYGNLNSPSINSSTASHVGYLYDIIPYNGHYVVVGDYSDANTNGQTDNRRTIMMEINENDGSVITGNVIDFNQSEQYSETRGVVYNATNSSFYLAGDYALTPTSGNELKYIAIIAQIQVSGSGFSVIANHTVENATPNNAIYPYAEMCYHPILHYNTQTSSSEVLVTRLEAEDNYGYSGDCLKCGENGSGPAEGFVDAFTPSLNPITSNDIGPLIATDLQMGITELADHTYAVVSTQRGNELNNNDDCNHYYCPYSFDQGCSGTPNTYNKEKWNTNAFVVKYTSGHALLWQRQIVESTDPADVGSYDFNDSPPNDFGKVGDPRRQGDLKREECFYNIIEGSEPGSLVLCGNNSNNLDDDNLIKLFSDCQSQLLSTFPDGGTSGGAAALPFSGTYGNVYTMGGNDIVINEGDNITWNQNGYVYGTVRVTNGAKLTIQNCTLQFLNTNKTNDNDNYDEFALPFVDPAIFTTIVVEIGGSLTIDNSTLEGVQNCGPDTWDGIEVWGNNGATQATSNQGVVSMINNSIIKDAYTGINVQKYDRTLGQWDVDNATGGGIVQVDHSSFLNCRFGVRFSTYPGIGQTAQSTSSFNYCNFVTDGNALNGLNTHATLYDIHGVTFTNCIFSSSVQLPSSQPAYGLASFNSEYYLGAFQDATQACSFSKLHRGQIAWGSSPSKFSGSPMFSIHNENTNFTDCDMALYYQGTDGCVTNNCSITWSTSYQLLDNTVNHYGIYLDGVGSVPQGEYYCINNTITASANGPQFGIITANHADPTNPSSSSVAGNTITNLPTSMAACGYNGNNNNTPRGLQFTCNQASGDFMDIAVTSYNYFDGSTPDQGSMSDQGKCNGTASAPDLALSDPANNTFNAQTSILLNSDVTTSFKYYYPKPTDIFGSGPYDPESTMNGVSGMNLNNIISCPVNLTDIASNSSAYPDLCTPRTEKILITSGIGITDITGQLATYDSLKLIFINSINGGSDSLLQAQIAGADAGTIGAVISSLSGYSAVTDDVLIAAIENPYTAGSATSAMLSLLIKNSSLSDTVVEILKASDIRFSSGELSELDSAQSQVPPLASIQSQISDISALSDEYLRSVVDQWGQEAREADIETLLGEIGSNESLMMLTDLRLARADTIGADSLLTHLSATGAFRTGAIQLRQIEASQLAKGMGINQLDSGQILTVSSIATSGIGAEVLRAKSILQLNRCQVYQEYIPTFDRLKLLKIPKSSPWADMKTVEKQTLSVVPNPGRDMTKITTQLIDASSPTELKITDALGNLILSKTLVQNYDVTSLPVGNLANGVYICAILQNGKMIMNSKIAVMH